MKPTAPLMRTYALLCSVFIFSSLNAYCLSNSDYRLNFKTLNDTISRQNLDELKAINAATFTPSKKVNFNFKVSFSENNRIKATRKMSRKNTSNCYSPYTDYTGLNSTLNNPPNSSNLSIATNTNLVWTDNDADLSLLQAPISINLSSSISNPLSSEVSFIPLQRIWKVIETSGLSTPTTIKVPDNLIQSLDESLLLYMFISDSDVFDASSKYKLLSPNESGNFETTYTLEGTNYITFAYAPKREFERSIYFDGSSSYINADNTLDLNSSGFTISAWVKKATSENGIRSIVSKRDTEFTKGYDFRILEDNRIEMIWKNPTSHSVTSYTALPDEQWRHISAIYDGSSISIFIDGVLDTVETTSPPAATEESFYIGAAGTISPMQFFKGHIDEVRVWDTALTKDQLRFIMNQEIYPNSTFAAGRVLPQSLTKNDIGMISWSNLAGYYPMGTFAFKATLDASGNDRHGELININTVDQQTAPLPYKTISNGAWNSASTWSIDQDQAMPNALSIVDNTTSIDWNIVSSNHNISMASELILARNRKLLGLTIEQGELTINDNALTISHYLKLNGKLDLEGESQLIQSLGSDLDPVSIGTLEKDQQGTADIYTYNYWSSPVGKINAATNNNSFAVKDVMYDDINPVNFLSSGYNGFDGAIISIADYWIWKYANHPTYNYSAWQHVRRNGTLLTGEGFTMKGPGSGSITDQQNYVFLGKPNNGDINLTLNAGNDYLVGNPYPSALDANQFIRDNGPTTVGNAPLITGTLYFWEHWGGDSHSLGAYQGGYATYNFSGGVPAPSFGTNSPDFGTGGGPTKVPTRYLPVSQGFFVIGENSGTINFNNGQRIFKKESSNTSVFLRSDGSGDSNFSIENIDNRMKFRIGFNSINTIHRQLLLTIDEIATPEFDWAFDAKTYDNQMDDLFWMIDDEKYNIQASNEATPETIFPLGIKTQNDGLNTITIDSLENVPESIHIFIHDTETDIYHNLRESDFELYLPAGQYLDRFELTFENANEESLSLAQKAINTIDAFYNMNTKRIALFNPNFVDVKSITLYNIIGQQITSVEEISELDYSEYNVKNLNAGTYVIQINTLSGLLSKKVLVK
ncbi:MAG: LamG-like jellyroll fold domain-containing protein [Psychroserpens sp.]|uniref:LamG-like jellyroll fold domain-containing protein n=1 Tax=Psychroserpens sp. TaxID=2020870 RepID=UPI003C9D0EB3